jgi:hypothetical protein
VEYDLLALMDIAGQIVKQAIRDYQNHYQHARHMDAGAFLRLPGLRSCATIPLRR